MSGYNGSNYNYSTNPSTGGKILREHITKITQPLDAVTGSNITPSGGAAVTASTLTTAASKVATLSGKGVTSSDTGCKSSCSGLCSSGCYTNCKAHVLVTVQTHVAEAALVHVIIPVRTLALVRAPVTVADHARTTVLVVALAAMVTVTAAKAVVVHAQVNAGKATVLVPVPFIAMMKPLAVMTAITSAATLNFKEWRC